MENKRLALLPMGKETHERTPPKVIELLFCFPVIWRKRSFGTRTQQGEKFVERLLSFRQTCRLQGKRTYPHLTEVFEHYLFGSKPVALFGDVRDVHYNVTSARSLPSLTLHSYIAKAVLAVLCRGCFLPFLNRRASNAL